MLTPLLAGSCALLAIYIVVTRRRLARLRETVRVAGAGYRDRDTGIYLLAGISGRLVPDVLWAAQTRRSLIFARFRWYCSGDRVAELERAVCAATRAYECAYRIGRGEILLVFVNVNSLGAIHAVRRFLDLAGKDVGFVNCDVGTAWFPEDGKSIDAVLDMARRRSRPWQDWVDAAQQLPWQAASPNVSHAAQDVPP